MNKHEFLKPALTGLAKLQLALKAKGGPSEDGELFEQILEVQDNLLQSFGLPFSPANQQLVFFDSLPTETEVEDRIEQLHQTAASYLLGTTKSELQTLREAKDMQLDGFDVLAELNVSSHVYTHFIYNKILLKGKDNPENVLQEFRLAEEYDVLNTLGQLEQGTLENEHEEVKKLKAIGLKYLNQFSIHNSNLLSDDDY